MKEKQNEKTLKEKIYSGSAVLGRGLLYACMYAAFRPKLTYMGRGAKEQISRQPVIYVANHTCHNDGQMMLTLFRGSGLLMAKDWMEKKVIRWIVTGTNCISIDRFSLDTAWLREAVACIKTGKDVVVFPEGHTSKNGEMDEFKSGFVMLSVMTGAPIVPVYIDGQYHKFLGRRLHIYIGKPVEITAEGRGMRADYLTAESERFRRMIDKMKGAVKNG